MKTRKCLLLCAAVVVVIAALFAATEVKAQIGPAITLQRTCTAGSLGTVVAGRNGDSTAEFPQLVNCTSTTNTADCPGLTLLLNGQFLRWDVRFTANAKTSPSLVGTQVASDVEIVAALGGTASTPGLEESSLKVGASDFDSRWLKFSGNNNAGSFFDAIYFTKPGLEARPEGVVFKSGNATASCLLAGAGKAVTEAHQAVSNQVVSQAGNCTVLRTVNARGRTIAMELDPPSQPACTLTTVTVNATNNSTNQPAGPPSFADPNSQITFGTNSTFCWPSVDASIWTCVEF